ncbi:uncharacterized protein OCT59_007320 [Rhizophagus irregularis]|uniref:uncharacterized protein n=1 Tax=Rhizophagus irregularis TaxID=588596 RepID=UPI00331A981A|nr:hypothetical protein OCT59_007320 [Rhizophagus irregularis]
MNKQNVPRPVLAEDLLSTKDTDLPNARRKRKAKKVDGWTYNRIRVPKEYHHLREINNTVNITMNHLGHFYLCVSVLLDIIGNQDDVRGKVISLDPGVMTGYDPDGQLIKWGNGDIDKVFKLSKKMNAITRLARWLCQDYEIILLPKFETSHMISNVSLHDRFKMDVKPLRFQLRPDPMSLMSSWSGHFCLIACRDPLSASLN